MAPSRCFESPRKHQSKGSGSSSPYKRILSSRDPSFALTKHRMLTRGQARYNVEHEAPHVPPLAMALSPPTASPSAHNLGVVNDRDRHVSPSKTHVSPSRHATTFALSKHSMLTRTRARCSAELESPLLPPTALLPPIATSTAHVLNVIHNHHGDMDSFARAIESMVSESHKELDQWAREEISTRDIQIEEERRLAENNKTEFTKMYELKLQSEAKELVSRKILENCQAQLLVLRRRIQESRSTREGEHRCPICMDLAWNPHVAPILQKPVPSLTIRHGVESIADAQGMTHPPLYRLQWPVRTSWHVRS
ncbi:hypothetical protein F5879DRAFT_920499 [Lentinula edodes]|uniref:uncharacterized protein n=1 Tax=Lentinula edodes TaxID=5353 RepID=UPI001E8EF2DE|nr:uncharacterized protein C8R40DRAFT_1069550 [Lentinula edodes]KAH7875034.1 hypothetical protein C8R40DRAFT_1069550 [Lentinula edodes]KAJ3906585.1 hypothetical protein F5879DRAFT_920499 [Lentinula edodes]KAJ3911965.1 hypothetical protein F5877DRAFT_72777 [Lentinula edodes]